jgi:hypothetical protein
MPQELVTVKTGKPVRPPNITGITSTQTLLSLPDMTEPGAFKADPTGRCCGMYSGHSLSARPGVPMQGSHRVSPCIRYDRLSVHCPYRLLFIVLLQSVSETRLFTAEIVLP